MFLLLGILNIVSDITKDTDPAGIVNLCFQGKKDKLLLEDKSKIFIICVHANRMHFTTDLSELNHAK